jgi:hypothetical protein
MNMERKAKGFYNPNNDNTLKESSSKPKKDLLSPQIAIKPHVESLEVPSTKTHNLASRIKKIEMGSLSESLQRICYNIRLAIFKMHTNIPFALEKKLHDRTNIQESVAFLNRVIHQYKTVDTQTIFYTAFLKCLRPPLKNLFHLSVKR